MSTYNPEEVNVVVLGIPIQGVMDGTFFEAEFQEAGITLYVGAQGFATFVENANKSGMLKFTTSQKSPSNGALSAAYAARAVGPVLMTDSSDDVETVVSGARAAISKHAPIRRGKEIQGYEWEVLIEKMVMGAGGDQP